MPDRDVLRGEASLALPGRRGPPSTARFFVAEPPQNDIREARAGLKPAPTEMHIGGDDGCVKVYIQGKGEDGFPLSRESGRGRRVLVRMEN